MAITNRPIAGTLMGALNLGGGGGTIEIIPEPQYYLTDPGVSASPAEKASLGIMPVTIVGATTDPFTAFGGPGVYVMKVPDAVKGMRFKLWGACGKANGLSPYMPDGGYVQSDLKVLPNELLLVIIGADAGEYDAGVVKSNLRALGGPGISLTTTPTAAVTYRAGGFTAVFRLTAELIAQYNIQSPAFDAMFARYFFRENTAAITDVAELLLLAGGSGSAGNANDAPNGDGGYPVGRQGTLNNGTSGGGGTQTAGGTGGTNSIVGVVGTKFQGGAHPANYDAGGGGGGYFGGGSPGFGGGAAQRQNGGGGSSFIHLSKAFNQVAPAFGSPAGDPDAPAISGATITLRRQGKLVVQWDTP